MDEHEPISERVSVIIPARNEEVNIARVVRSLANASRAFGKSWWWMTSRSTGRGKFWPRWKWRFLSFALCAWSHCRKVGWGRRTRWHMGARAATGDWLLFTDADTEHLAGSLAELLQRAEDEHADLLSLSPGQETPTWWEKSVIPLVYVKLASLFRFEEVSDPQSPAAAANGQYMLVRREIYERSGGHEAVKSAILEDVELARRIKALGGKLLFLPGARWVRTRMYHSFREMWQGWTKNLYLLYEGNASKMLAAVASLWLLDLFPVLAFMAACLWVAFSARRRCGHAGGRWACSCWRWRANGTMGGRWRVWDLIRPWRITSRSAPPCWGP